MQNDGAHRDDPVWLPDPERARSSHLTAFIERCEAAGAPIRHASESGAFASLHAWSIAHPERFWAAAWKAVGVVAAIDERGAEWKRVLVGGNRMAPPGPAGPRWFEGAQLNFAENLLRRGGDTPAIISWDERGRNEVWSWDHLRTESARIARGLSMLGVMPGDRVAAWMPNIPETIAAMLGAARIGAVWTSCSPDFGVDGIVDRFGQTAPVVLFYCDAYQYAGKIRDCSARIDELLSRLPSVRTAVRIPFRGEAKRPSDLRVSDWMELGRDPSGTPAFARLPFDHPLYILYSSGTTGLPKCMVHSAGGTLLQHLKEHQLHIDLRPGERIFYFTTCGWMMWNWQVTALASGATLVLYDGAPLPEAEPAILWRMASEERVNVFGTSAKYLSLAEKGGLRPQHDFPLDQLRTVLSTGSPLAAEGFDWVRREVGAHVQTASISGGTDIVSCFVLGNPISPVYRGEIQGAGLGMAVDIFDAEGNRCPTGQPGELVCTTPFPAMPVGFWNDPDGSRYRAAYFDTYPGVWRHGDWIERTTHGGYVISGRSDATLNPGGVRIGTAEIYRQVEAMGEVIESLVVGQRVAGDERVVLFVRLVDGASLTPELVASVRERIRAGTSPHHVPRVVVAVSDIPRTRSGKLSELAVRDVIEGRDVANLGALANPESLAEFRNRSELA